MSVRGLRIALLAVLVASSVVAQEPDGTGRAVAELRRARDGDAVRAGVEGMQLAGAAAPRILAELSKLVEESSTSSVIQEALWAVGYLDPSGELALPIYLAALRRDHPSAQLAAARCVVELGEAARPAVPLMVAGYLGWGKPARAAENREQLWYRDMREGVLQALTGLGVVAEAAVPPLLSEIEKHEESLTVAMITALAALDPSGRKTLDAVVSGLRSADTLVHNAATSALAAMGPGAAPAVPVLMAGLGAEDVAWQRLGITRALGAIGPRAEAAKPLLMAGLMDELVSVVKDSADALDAVCPQDLEEPRDIVAQLDAAAPESIDPVLLWKVARLDIDSRVALVPRLAGILRSQDDRRELMALRALADLDSLAAPAVGALGELLQRHQRREERPAPLISNWDHELIVRAVEVLGRIGPGATDVIPLIRRASGTTDDWVTEEHLPVYAIRAIDRILQGPRFCLEVRVDPELEDRGAWWMAKWPYPGRRVRRPTPAAECEPDGSFLIAVGNGDGLHGGWIEFYLSRDRSGRARVQADRWTFTDCGPPFRWKEKISKGVVTLRSEDWTQPAAIVGLFEIDGQRGGFRIENPFVR